MYSEEQYLERFYEALANNNERAILNLQIPPSDVFYVREAIHQRTGVRYSLKHVQKIMEEEGFL